MIKLYGYYRSSATYRVRIALNLKDLQYSQESVHLLRDGGQQHSQEYQQVNPQKLVPTLIVDDKVFSQSLAIIEYLEERFPTPSLLPKDLNARARIRALSQIIVSDVHPLNNLRVLQYLGSNFHISEEQKNVWYCHWITEGLRAFEQLLVTYQEHGNFCYGDQPSLADVCLVPQVFNALRFGCPLAAYPIIQRINANCLALQAFDLAHPNKQADAE